MKNGDLPNSYVNVYQRLVLGSLVLGSMIHGMLQDW